MPSDTRQFARTRGAAPSTSPASSAPSPATTGHGWRLLSIKEIAAACQLSEKAVRRAIDAGELPAVKLRSRLRVTPQDFEDWIAGGRQAAHRPFAPPRRRASSRAPEGTFRSLVQATADRGAEL